MKKKLPELKYKPGDTVFVSSPRFCGRGGVLRIDAEDLILRPEGEDREVAVFTYQIIDELTDRIQEEEGE